MDIYEKHRIWIYYECESSAQGAAHTNIPEASLPSPRPRLRLVSSAASRGALHRDESVSSLSEHPERRRACICNVHIRAPQGMMVAVMAKPTQILQPRLNLSRS